MINYAIQKGSYVHVYNERNVTVRIFAGELVGYTATSITIGKGDWVSVYNGINFTPIGTYRRK